MMCEGEWLFQQQEFCGEAASCCCLQALAAYQESAARGAESQAVQQKIRYLNKIVHRSKKEAT